MYNIPVFKQLVELLHWILVTLHDLFAGWGLGPDWTWGLAIIGLTIIVRLVLFPLTWKQFKNQQALQVLQPKMKELQRKYKDDRAMLQRKQMELYQEHRVNPFASCLPLLLQLPVFIALYAAISGRADYLDPATVRSLADAGFLWIQSVAEGGSGLGQPDPTHILLVLYVVTQLISTELMLASQTDKMQKWLMRSMPVVFVFILWNFPSGLFVYWVTTNLWTIGQQLLIRKAMKPHAMPAADKPGKRSRIVDALVSAQKGTEQNEATKPGAGAAKKQARSTGKTPSAGSTKSKKKPRAGDKPSSADARMPSDSGAGESSVASAKPGGSRPQGKRRRGGKRRPSGKPSRAGGAGPTAAPTARASHADDATDIVTQPPVEPDTSPDDSSPSEAMPPVEDDVANSETRESDQADS